MASIHRQLILHGLPLPSELIRFIKDYTFMDITEADSKKKKNVVTNLFKNTLWSNKARPIYSDSVAGDYVFWIEEDEGSPQIQNMFCEKCGNYTFAKTMWNKVICKCNM
jgi:hypothetical protein